MAKVNQRQSVWKMGRENKSGGRLRPIS